MTALTLSVLPVPAARPGRRHLRVVAPGRPSPAVAVRRRPEAGVRPTPLRITRRGRLTVTVLATAALSVAAVAVAGVPEVEVVVGPPHVQVSQPPTSVVVLPGQTLWQIAAEVDPEADRRDAIARILSLNDLETSEVLAGQTLLLPAA